MWSYLPTKHTHFCMFFASLGKAPIMAEPPPAYWMIFVRWFLHTSDRLAKHLWHAFEHDCSPVVRWQLHICSERPTIERQQAFLDLVRPRHLLVAAERLCPAGKRR